MAEEDAAAFTDEELIEIRKFLHSSYLTVAAERPSALSRNPKDQVDPEIERLRKKKTPRNRTPTLSDRDVSQIAEALDSPFAKDLGGLRGNLLLQEIDPTLHDFAASSPLPSLKFGQILLRNSGKRLCSNLEQTKLSTITISAAGLSAVLSSLGFSPLYAPVAIWFASRLRDFGLPVFCRSVDEYLRQKHV
jgi:hypothetical protein